MNFKLLSESVLYENELVLIAEQAEQIVKKLNTLTDFALEADKEADIAKKTTKESGKLIDTKELFALRNKLMQVVSNSRNWPKNLSQEEKEKKLDQYIMNGYIDPTNIVGLNGERLSPNLNLKGLRYLHRKFIGNT